MEPSTPYNPVILFGTVDFRNRKTNFGVKMDDRRRHIYVIGKSGMGKSELLKNFAIQDIQEGRGLAFVDPHGDPVEDLLDYIPPERIDDVIYINPADMQYPISFNVMEHVDYDQRHLVADGLMAVFKKIWVDQWSARMEYILNNTILALLEAPGSTLLGINRMMADKEYRKSIVDQVKDSEVKAFWTQEFAKYNDRYAQEATAAIQNKIGQFVSNSLIRNIVGQVKSSFDIRKAIDEKKIILANISKGRIGEDASRLLGAMIITRIQLAAMSRVNVTRDERPDFALIVDEFQNFATASFANILSEARKFNLSLIIAHQYVSQMSDEVRDAVFGNVGTIVSFRVGAEDAELLEKEFMPVFGAQDVVNLGKRDIYLKLAIDGITSTAFAARTMDTITAPEASTREQVILRSRQLYGRPRQGVEEAIEQWRAPLPDDRVDTRPNPAPRPTGQSGRQYSPSQPKPSGSSQPSRTGSTSRPGGERRDDRPDLRKPKPAAKTDGPQQRERQPRRDNSPRRDSGSGRSPAPAPKQKPSDSQGTSLDALAGGGAVDFKGRPVQKKEKREEKDGATLTSTSSPELKALIARALGKTVDGS